MDFNPKPMDRTSWRGGYGAPSANAAPKNLRWGKSVTLIFNTTAGLAPAPQTTENLVYAHDPHAFAWQVQIGVDARALGPLSEAAPILVEVTTTIGNGQDATNLVKDYTVAAPYATMLLDNGQLPVDTIQDLRIQITYGALAAATAQEPIRVLAYAAPFFGGKHG